MMHQADVVLTRQQQRTSILENRVHDRDKRRDHVSCDGDVHAGA